jgi:hypothetical protein
LVGEIIRNIIPEFKAGSYYNEFRQRLADALFDVLKENIKASVLKIKTKGFPILPLVNSIIIIINTDIKK